MPTLLEIPQQEELLRFLEITESNNRAEPSPKLKLIALNQHIPKHRTEILIDVLEKRVDSRILLSHAGLANEERYFLFVLPNKSPIPFWDGYLLRAGRPNFIFGTYPPGTPDFSGLTNIRRFVENRYISKRLELDYDNIRGLLIPMRVDGKLQEVKYYFTC